MSQLPALTAVLPAISARTTAHDRSGDWPAEDLADLSAIGAFRWFVPPKFGGDGVEALELHLRYESIASASLATALVVSQRDSAVGLIDGSDNHELQEMLLPPLARGEFFSTIGIAQLTTSRQGGLHAQISGDDFILDGAIPWSTGAAKAKFIVAGALLDDGNQILFVLPMDLPGVMVMPPMQLVSLRASWTSRVELKSVHLQRRWILRGPAAKALAGRSKGIALGQAFLAFGLCRGALQVMMADSSDRAKFLAEKFGRQLSDLHDQVVEVCRNQGDADSGSRLRAECHDLTLRITQSLVALRKGSALLLDDPAQRLAREALFFLVWSCPDPVIECTVEILSRV